MKTSMTAFSIDWCVALWERLSHSRLTPTWPCHETVHWFVDQHRPSCLGQLVLIALEVWRTETDHCDLATRMSDSLHESAFVWIHQLVRNLRVHTRYWRISDRANFDLGRHSAEWAGFSTQWCVGSALSGVAVKPFVAESVWHRLVGEKGPSDRLIVDVCWMFLVAATSTKLWNVG